MSEPAAQTVRSFLHDLEEQRQIKILFAVESGAPGGSKAPTATTTSALSIAAR